MSISTDSPRSAPAARHPAATEAFGQSDGLGLRRPPSQKKRKKRGVLWLIIGLIVFAAVASAGGYLIYRQFRVTDENLVWYTAKRGDLALDVTERGTIESQENVVVQCEVDDLRDDGIRGTPISWIIRNGEQVKRGNIGELCAGLMGTLAMANGQSSLAGAWTIGADTAVMPNLLVELESAGHVERLDRQIIAHERANTERIQALAKYKNQKVQNETMAANAALDVKLAVLDLEMFEKVLPIPFFYPSAGMGADLFHLVECVRLTPARGDDGNFKGTFPLELDEIDRKIDDINSDILAAQAKYELAKRDLYATESLHKLGYATKSDLDRSRLELLQSESAISSKMNSLKTQYAARQKKIAFEKIKQRMTLKGNVATAIRKEKQVHNDNEALLAQAKAKLNEAERSYKKETELLNRYRDQVEKCTIYAPVSGMVAYVAKDPRRWWQEEIRQGAPLNRRQDILTIPNLSKMQVKTSVHESVVDKIEKGLPATIRLEAYPDKRYSGRVKSVAVLADQQSPESKVFETIVTIDGEVEQIKPGMTAIVEIHLQRVRDAVTVPVQAIVEVRGDYWVYVDTPNGVERRDVTPGETNHKHVEIREGLEEGDRVVLNPMIIVDASNDGALDEKDEEDDGSDINFEPQTPQPKQAQKQTKQGGRRNGQWKKKSGKRMGKKTK